MNPTRRTLAAALALSALGVAPLARAQQPVPGRDYLVLNPEQPVETQGGRIEVIEFFWYGCIHCYNLEPPLEAWLKRLPADAQFRRVPAVFNERWGLDASIFYAFEALGLLEKLHWPLFGAIHRERLKTDNLEAFSQWLGKQGVDAKKVIEATRSFGVQSRVKRATQMTVAYRVEGTPSMAVHGRYLVSDTAERMLATTDHLIAQARKSLGKK
jgi:thiol:disulfide interchange protein DsbA